MAKSTGHRFDGKCSQRNGQSDAIDEPGESKSDFHGLTTVATISSNMQIDLNGHG
jgi:hypothetical protein